MTCSDELTAMSATAQRGLLASRQISACELLDVHIGCIERWNPTINALVSLDLDAARAAAQTADAAQARGEALGLLHGLPVAHKDLLLTCGMRTTFGSRAFEHFVPTVDSLIVARQRAAGAITLGKTNVPEFGAGSHTFNAVFGITRNPYDPTRSAGGSSGGAAAALASGMVALADGTDMGGSLRNPASFCNVVGLRPSFGCVPQWPVASPFSALTVAGPMGRTVADAALLLSVLAGADRRDPWAAVPGGMLYHEQLPREFKGTRIAWSHDVGGLPFEPEVLSIVTAALAGFTALGCVIDAADPPLAGADAAFHVFRALAFANAYKDLLTEQRDKLKNTVVWNIERGLHLTAAEILDAEGKRKRLFQAMHEFMEDHEFLITPAVQALPFPVEQEYPETINGVAQETYIAWQKSLYLFSVTGHPAIVVPCGFTQNGLPVGLQIVGRYRDELGVLQLAHAFEAAQPFWRQRPKPP